jgi:hypothetical protein
LLGLFDPEDGVICSSETLAFNRLHGVISHNHLCEKVKFYMKSTVFWDETPHRPAEAVLHTELFIRLYLLISLLYGCAQQAYPKFVTNISTANKFWLYE